ncbi:MAG TPA: hypothetical protein VIC29_06390 [Steroidobacteraceae bacterium]|jgi:membrane-bound metal-dependent hydrolase YbcI (DUF457 family)
MAHLPCAQAAAMIAGHFGLAALVKSRERAVPLWSLMLATVWLDIVFVPLFLAGIETIEPAPGTHGGYGAGIIHANYTHSLLGAILLSAILGAACGARWGRQSGLVVGLVAFSHWLLDLIVHRGDLPLLPGNAGHLPTLGFGLWRAPAAAMSLELALVVAGAWLYYRAARSACLAARINTSRAAWVAALILVGGTAVLALDVTGVLG